MSIIVICDCISITDNSVYFFYLIGTKKIKYRHLRHDNGYKYEVQLYQQFTDILS